MPTTVFGLLLTIPLLLPGLAYTLREEHGAPGNELSAFRESALVLLVSTAADTTALLVFSVIRALLPHLTPDVGQLIRSPGNYARTSYGALVVWGCLLLIGATLLAVKAADRGSRLHAQLTAAARLARVSPTQSTEGEPFASAWWLLLSQPADIAVSVGCYLDDGSYVFGRIRSWNRAIIEAADRDLVLAGPVEYRGQSDNESHILDNASAVVVSARNIRLLMVRYEALSPNPSAQTVG
jgi:hypothetical protein